MGGVLCLNTCAENKSIRENIVRKLVYFPPICSYEFINKEMILLHQ